MKRCEKEVQIVGLQEYLSYLIGLEEISLYAVRPSSEHTWSISYILKHEFFCLGHLGSQGNMKKKSGFELF